MSMKKINSSVLLTLLSGLLLSQANAQTDLLKEKPADPFDYNFCGGERVYPIVGVNIATACGPRNQVALGRRGKIMWLFPGMQKQGNLKGAKAYRGQMQLSEQQLAKLSILAEVAKITDSMEPKASKVLYKMGINFSARQPKYIFAAADGTYSPSNELLKQMLAIVPETEKIYLPDCGKAVKLFNPTLNLEQRQQQVHNTDPNKVAKVK